MATKRNSPRAKPHSAIPLRRAGEAWWYENAGDIEVYIAPEGGGEPLACKIKRREIEGYLRWIGRMP